MLLGADTGFFVAYANPHPRATVLWEELSNGLHHLVVASISLTELLVYFFKRGNGELAQEWLNLMRETELISIVPLSVEIAAPAARLRHGMGLPTVDATIVATFLEQGCAKALSTDGDFRIVDEQQVLAVEFLI